MLGYPPTEGGFKKVTVYAQHKPRWTENPLRGLKGQMTTRGL